MSQVIAFNAATMRTSAATTRSAFVGISDSKLSRVEDCGSALVAETVEFFLEHLENALARDEVRSEALAANIEASAADFSAAEAENQRKIQALLSSLQELY